MSAQFTPGPWAVTTCAEGEGCWCRIICVAGHEDIKDLEYCVIHSGAVHKRNACLIAAAPELYEALSKCASMIRHAVGADVFVDPEHTMRLSDVTALLAKARGEA